MALRFQVQSFDCVNGLQFLRFSSRTMSWEYQMNVISAVAYCIHSARVRLHGCVRCVNGQAIWLLTQSVIKPQLVYNKHVTNSLTQLRRTRALQKELLFLNTCSLTQSICNRCIFTSPLIYFCFCQQLDESIVCMQNKQYSSAARRVIILWNEFLFAAARVKFGTSALLLDLIKRLFFSRNVIVLIITDNLQL